MGCDTKNQPTKRKRVRSLKQSSTAHNDILLELEALGVHGNPLVADEEEFMDAILQHVDEEEFMDAILQYVDETGKEITK